jgi:hypothetical protein
VQEYANSTVYGRISARFYARRDPFYIASFGQKKS